MKRILLAACCLFVTALFTSSYAQTQEEMKKWMDFMTPSDIHQMMAKWDGPWNEEIQMWMAPGAPVQTMTASCVNRMVLGGRYQESKHTGSMNGMPFEGISTTAWDNARKVISTTWVDNMGTGLMYMEGTWDAATKTINLKGKTTDPMTGLLTDIREVMKIVDESTQLMQQFGMKDGKEYKTMEVKFTRPR